MLKVYVCGPTVYSDIHIGNLRPIISMDLILRAARNINIDFTFIHNITDIDDKIIDRAFKSKKTEKEISTRYTKKYLDILKKTNVDTISRIELVTENLDIIVNYINTLVETKNAYFDKAGNVLFDVEKNKNNYGAVSNQNLSKMIFSESQIEKKFQADFSLWKKTTLGIKYPSIFGEGRPGWHTECCALIYKHFGKSGADVHGGGSDLIFPHHENENIQHYSLFGNNLSNDWWRSGQININGQKMSKSLGNVWLAKEFLKVHDPNLIRMIILNSNVTAPINITDETISFAKNNMDKINRLYFQVLLNEGGDILKHSVSEEYRSYNKLVFEKNFSSFNFKVNENLKAINVEFDLSKASTLLRVYEDLGFVFHLRKLKSFVEMYHKWQKYLLEKDYHQADIVREVLKKENLL